MNLDVDYPELSVIEEGLQISEWSIIVGVTNSAITWRLNNGWSVEEALTTKGQR